MEGNISKPMTFTKAISSCLTKYADFGGRATRAEYWWFYLFALLLGLVTYVIDHSALGYPKGGWGPTRAILTLALFLPQMAAMTRRMHDTNRSGWNWLWCLTVIGIIPFFVWMISRGDQLENKYGPVP